MGVPGAEGVVELEAEVASFLVAVAEIELVMVAVSQRVTNVLQAEVDTHDQNAELEVLVPERLDAREAG